MRKIDSLDHIQSMSDEELAAKIRITKSVISRENIDRSRLIDAEIDLCYYLREDEIRQQRRDAHQRWLYQHHNKQSENNRI